ncbi:MAG: hypothetical protein WDN47_03205 [Candidatus Doudnabacteria bacterium]
MALTAREFLRRMETDGFREEDKKEAERRRQEELKDDQALRALSDAIERHPIHTPRIRRG